MELRCTFILGTCNIGDGIYLLGQNLWQAEHVLGTHKMSSKVTLNKIQINLHIDYASISSPSSSIVSIT